MTVGRRIVPIALAIALAGALAPGASARAPAAAELSPRLVSHEARFLDAEETRPSIFGYTTELAARTFAPAEPVTDQIADPVRLDRDDLAPSAPPDTPLTWAFAGRGAPAKINAQDSLPVFALAPARANPYATAWYHRQETARDLWSWGGLLRGGIVSGEERSQNAIFGLGPSAAAYPERPGSPATGRLQWRDRTLVRSAVATDRDPTGEPFDGTFWGLLSRPTLEVVGGDLAAETDVQSPPLVLELPVKPSGAMFFSTPPAPPGVEIEWSRSFDFDARTVTVTATVKAGSVWPESGFDEELDHGGDRTLPRWTWTPWLFFMGWDYGDLINGGPAPGLAAGRIRADGSYEAPHRLRPDGLPDLPAGMLDASLPRGTVVETAWGERARVGGVRLPAPPGPSPTPHALRDAPEGAALSGSETSEGLSLDADGTEIGTLAVPAVTIDGTPRLLNEGTLLDRWVEPDSWIVEIHETGGVFLSTVVVLGQGTAAYYLWDAHSTDGLEHEVLVHTLVDPALAGDEGDLFREPFYTGGAYATERKLPQGILDFPVGTLLHGWIGSLPAIEAVDEDAGGSILHMQLWPNLGGNVAPDALRTFAYLERDRGTYDPDAEGAIADEEGIVGTDVAMDLVNGYSGMIWDRSFLPFFSWFFVTPPSV